ncbi:hypothetical protein ACN20G_14945 [Streptomyces sp. BI20]|uniref:hypothetical protein n=1 Tax=Streptomyces sp. BI20 TaxID=3403460 RepID=UPI003C74B92E
MKYAKVAAAVVGSVAALGVAASPALAADAPAAVPMSLTGGAEELIAAATPVSEGLTQHAGNALAEQDQTVEKVVSTAAAVNKARNDLPGTALGAANLLGEAAPGLLGGMHINNGLGGQG